MSAQFEVPNIVLLAAGSGRRMLPLTAHCPKALLPVGDRTVLDLMIDAIDERCDAQITVVTGFARETVEAHVRARHGARIALAHNARFEHDTNILSVETGVAALARPGRGYLVCETDLLLDAPAWDALFAQLDPARSQWVCRGRYSPALTGGIVHAGTDGAIDAIEYRPQHDSCYDGWDKMLGMLWVAPAQVDADRRTRQAAIAQTIAQYYLVPWQRHLTELACAPLRLEQGRADTFNTAADFERATADFLLTTC